MSGSQRPCALVADDEAAIRQLLSRLLENAGWEVIAAGDGPQALQAFVAGRFQRVFCDIDLGQGMTGLQVAQELQAAQPGLRVVFITGSPSNAQKAQAAGAGQVLMKPFDPSQILALLDHGL